MVTSWPREVTDVTPLLCHRHLGRVRSSRHIRDSTPCPPLQSTCFKKQFNVYEWIVSRLTPDLHYCLVNERSGRCPALEEWGVCPVPANRCLSDEECGGREKCCATACGPACVKSLFTGCEQVQMEATRQARALGPDGTAVRIPRCNSLGDFDEVQCNAKGSLCWCVDKAGFELEGTRVSERALVNCSNPRNCGGAQCRMLCPHGFALQEDGCPKCECRDPCSEVKCLGSMRCEVEDVACASQPCPPVPKCKRGRSLENICPTGSPLTITDSDRPFLCGTAPGRPNCPPLFSCFVQSGHDYGVCCPSSFELQKPGSCPAKSATDECGMSCEHDLECSSMQKCCTTDNCGKHCTQPQNVTVCLQQKMLAELLVMNEKEGKGYVPQCSALTGEFEPRQCSRNGLVCWCVDIKGNKQPGSMGPMKAVICPEERQMGRSASVCDTNLCAQMCEYGFKVDSQGCPTCECDDPCQGFQCGPEEQCVALRDDTCTDFLCPTLPVCRANPCKSGPLKDPLTGELVTCTETQTTCAAGHTCSQGFCCADDEDNGIIERQDAAVSKSGECPVEVMESCGDAIECETDEDCPGDMKCCLTEECGGVCAGPVSEERPPSMCEYLRDFPTKMEGTRDGMRLAIPTPSCHNNGSYEYTQCVEVDGRKECWCVDGYGTEIPDTRSAGAISVNCIALRQQLDCLDVSCRLGCDYGFVLDPQSRCPQCECRNPCEVANCEEGSECQIVEVNCQDDYCPPVPACLPKKSGQCPYLIPVRSGSCDFECKSDLNCNSTAKCCSNGCGTLCVEPVIMTACQHQRAILQHKAHEMGIPARQMYTPQCNNHDGSFELVQCHPQTRQCWCVDQSGEEVPGTRAPPDVQPSCKAPVECPLVNCSVNCEHGYQLDSQGCRTCSCKDPCKELSCREDGESCRLVEVTCVDQPCPPIPMCLPHRENPCQGGHPLLHPGSNDVVQCGPTETTCPSSHKCHLSPLGEYAVCCPKPRDVCFEKRDEGPCNTNKTTRWFFNTDNNRCEEFQYGGCAGNQNNFVSQQICNAVCPVLSQCERLREKNQKMSERYKKATFLPRCDSETGRWLPVQCLDHVGVCWCSDKDGEPIKGTLTRNEQPICNFRQARRRMHVDKTSFAMEELLKEVGLMEDPERKTRCQALRELMTATNSLYAVECDAHGRFAPTQCYPRDSEKFPECWCVDEAGNQLPNTTTFKKGAKICLPVPIEAVEVKLGFYNYHNKTTEKLLESELKSILQGLGAKLKNDLIEVEIMPDVIYVHFSIIGNNKVDAAYYLEEMVKSEKVYIKLGPYSPVIADITKSRFSQKLLEDTNNPMALADRVIALEHREVVSQSTISEVKPYQTAIIVLTAGSAFIICILILVIALYRRKMSSTGLDGSSLSRKSAELGDNFFQRTSPVYVVSLPPKEHDTESFPRIGLVGSQHTFESFKSHNMEDKTESGKV
uniref:Uncharacterized protein n=1 Tax=Timema douglasi TaxID=61478 RepID=A0A7R8VC68_TIMDO|nr:unnamed protein product [Timema douglasi]